MNMDGEKEYYSLVKRAFDILAPFYDLVTVPVITDRLVRDKVVNFTNAGKDSIILDVATGTGKQAFAFAKKGYNIIGIDLSEAMLKVAKTKNKYGNVTFQVADATQLRFKDSHFDVSCVSFALHDMPLTIREKVLREMVRVTKPNGMIVIVDYALPESKMGRFFIYRLVRLYEGEYYSKFINSDLEALLRKTGIETKEELKLLLGAGRILKGIKIEQAAQ